MKKIIVTGGFGTLGTKLCKRLRAEGNYVIVYDRVLPEPGVSPQADEYFIFDLRNAPDFYGSFRWKDADEVYQMAKGATDEETALIERNVSAAADQAGVPRFISRDNMIAGETTG